MTTTAPPRADEARATPIGAVRDWVAGGGLRDRTTLLAGLIVALIVVMTIADVAGLTSGRFDSDYLAGALIAFVPLALLALAQLLVITSGRGGIDLSVGSMVSLVGIVFGMLYAQAGWPLVPAVVVAIAFGALLGAINGFLTAYLGYPALITTLATFYAYRSLALVISDSRPISGPEIQALYEGVRAIELPVIGATLPLVPLGVFTFLLPVAIGAWVLLNRTTYGRRLYAIGTNDVAAQWAGIDPRRTRMTAYLLSGALSGLVAVYTVAQFASARPDAGTSGSGMALPAITIAVLGGVAITGGIGRLSGVLLAALLIVWLNASILIVVPGNDGSQMQLLALGVVLLGASLLGGISQRRRRAGLVAPAPMGATQSLQIPDEPAPTARTDRKEGA
ncbi:ABC transporter permease [Agrococcus sp. SGAir0287]|uniref:ABC transporter permease n=1 Tax=Agrococcus sp. SGAir0287 TaxID=2070347 RepID=UPI0010CD5A18|nr:ABC transporter permease [Agrococcus sp. SGAir0287]QCR18361.1 ABC transporter permease [Agrococcus sp. SGAir0287]